MPSRLRSLLRSFRHCARGSVVIETAFVAPVLITMALGGYEVSRIVSRQHELQTGAAEAEAIALAANQGASTDTTTLKSILMGSLSLQSSQVTVDKLYRCGTSSTLQVSSSGCGTGQVVSSYVRLTLTDSYTPAWTRFGVGSTLNFSVVRMVQLS
jgi:Flp pilus assembly protein TadG